MWNRSKPVCASLERTLVYARFCAGGIWDAEQKLREHIALGRRQRAGLAFIVHRLVAAVLIVVASPASTRNRVLLSG